MLSLLLSASLLGGIGSSQRMGERSPFAVVGADASLRAVRVEASWDSAAKLETGDGWALRGAVDWRTGFLTLGGGYSYRHTGAWDKSVWWARAGVQSGPLWLLASIAPDSPNLEAKAEARIRLRHRWAIVEPRAWVGYHSATERLGAYSWGLDMLVGATR